MLKATFRLLHAALLAGGLAMLTAPAHAADGALLELLKILRDKGGITQQEYELLRDTAMAETETPAQAPAEPAPAWRRR